MKRYVVGFGHETFSADYFVGLYDSPEDAIQNAKRYSLDHGCIGMTIFKAIQTVKAEIPAMVKEIE